MTHPDLTPTDQDRSRDLRADLALCDAATPGPWHADWRGTNHFELTTHAPGAKDLWLSMPDSGIQKGEDLDMIAESREGWPAAIRRALSAEAEVATLRAYVGSEIVRSDYQTAAHMRADLERLRQRVEELEQQRREQE